MRRLRLSIYYLQELNYRLGYTAYGAALLFLTTYHYKQGLIYIIIPRGLSHFVSTSLTEIFFTYIQLCTFLTFNASIILASVQIYLFLRPGLYTYEAKTALNILMAAICFYLSIYAFIFPPLIKILWQLFSSYSQNFTPIHLTFEPRLNDYLKNVQQLNKMLSLSFPCIFLLSIIQKNTEKHIWIKYRGIAYITAFIVAAFITPPDVLSQTIIGLPLIIFYELQVATWAIYKEYKRQLLIRKPIKRYKNTLRDKE